MKNLSLNKHLKFALTLTIFIGFVTLLLAGCAEHRETKWNEALFWDANRTVNGFGVFMAILGWGFWEFFVSCKRQRAISAYLGILFTIIGLVMINGYMGIIAGSIILVLQIFVLVVIHIQTKMPLSISFIKIKAPLSSKKIKKGGK